MRHLIINLNGTRSMFNNRSVNVNCYFKSSLQHLKLLQILVVLVVEFSIVLLTVQVCIMFQQPQASAPMYGGYGQPYAQPFGMAVVPAANQTVIVQGGFDAGARFDGNMSRPNIPVSANVTLTPNKQTNKQTEMSCLHTSFHKSNISYRSIKTGIYNLTNILLALHIFDIIKLETVGYVHMVTQINLSSFFSSFSIWHLGL